MNEECKTCYCLNPKHDWIHSRSSWLVGWEWLLQWHSFSATVYTVEFVLLLLGGVLLNSALNWGYSLHDKCYGNQDMLCGISLKIKMLWFVHCSSYKWVLTNIYIIDILCIHVALLLNSPHQKHLYSLPHLHIIHA